METGFRREAEFLICKATFSSLSETESCLSLKRKTSGAEAGTDFRLFFGATEVVSCYEADSN